MGSPTLKSDRIRAQLSHNIKALLEHMQISENELAKRSGVSQKQVNNIVQRRTGCGVDALEAIAEAGRLRPYMLLHPHFDDILQNAARYQRLVDAYHTISPSKRELVDALLSEIK